MQTSTVRGEWQTQSATSCLKPFWPLYWQLWYLPVWSSRGGKKLICPYSECPLLVKHMLFTHKHTATALRVSVQLFSNYQQPTDLAWTYTRVCSTGHERTAHWDSCRCRNGNFNEVSTAVVVSSPFLLRENGTLSTLPWTGPMISLEIEPKT